MSEFLNCSSITWIKMQQLYCISCWCRHICLLSKLSQQFCWCFLLASTDLSFLSAYVFSMSGYCKEWNLLLTALSNMCKLFLEQSHQETFIWPYQFYLICFVDKQAIFWWHIETWQPLCNSMHVWMTWWVDLVYVLSRGIHYWYVGQNTMPLKYLHDYGMLKVT